jgi:hypothetical protein
VDTLYFRQVTAGHRFVGFWGIGLSRRSYDALEAQHIRLRGLQFNIVLKYALLPHGRATHPVGTSFQCTCAHQVDGLIQLGRADLVHLNVFCFQWLW